MDDRSNYIYTPTSPSWARSPTSPTAYGASPTSPIAPTWPSVTSPATPHFASSSSRLPFDYSSSSSSTSYPSLSGASFTPVSPSTSSFTPFSSFPAPSPPPLDSQKEPSSGPNRALTRRQRAALQNRVGASSTRPATSRPVFRQGAAASSSTQPQASTSGTSTQQQQQQSQTPTPSDSSSSLRSASPASPALSNSSSLTSVSSASPLLPPSSPFPSTSAQFSTPPGQFATPLNLSRTKSRKQRLFNIDRKEICKYAAENPNSRQEDIAMRFGVERSTISKILKNKSRWLNVPSDEEMRIAKHRPSKFPEIEEELVLWLASMQEQAEAQSSDPSLPYNAQGRIQLTDQLIRTQARTVARRLGVPEDKFKASSGWVENFKHRHGIRGGVWRGDGKNAKAARAMGKGGPGYQEVQLTPTHHSDSSTVDSAFDAQAHTPIDLQPSSLSLSTDSSNSSFDSSYAGHTTNYVPTQPAYPSFSQDSYSGNPYPASHYTEPAYPQPAPGADIPTHAEAEASLNRLLAYLDTAGQNIVTDDERKALDRVKRAMFQAASGIPYNRSSSG